MACSKQRFPMPPSRRAKQFMAFDALKGFKEAIAAKERFTEPRRELSDTRIQEINKKLTELTPGQLTSVVFYDELEENYLQITGSVKKIDYRCDILRIGETAIDFQEIYELEIMDVE